MSLILALESLKFYKLKQERIVHVLFLLCFGLNAVNFLFPVGDTDFSNLNAWLTRYSAGPQGMTGGLVSYPPALSAGNLVFLGTQTIIIVLNLFVSYFYAAAYSAERDGLPAAKGQAAMIRTLPRHLTMLFLLLVPAFFSLFLLGIPLIIGSLMLIFVPLLVAERRENLQDAISDSIALTNHRKAYIFFAFLLLGMVNSVLEQAVLLFAANNRLAFVLLSAMLAAVAALMRGRLIGICYVFFAKQLRSMSLSQLMNRTPQDIIGALLGPEDKEKDKDRDH